MTNRSTVGGLANLILAATLISCKTVLRITSGTMCLNKKSLLKDEGYIILL